MATPLADDMQVPLESRLLAWKCDRGTYKAQTPRAIGLVFPHRRGYSWEILVAGEVKYAGHVRSLHSALCHVEGNMVGRGLLEEQADEPMIIEAQAAAE